MKNFVLMCLVALCGIFASCERQDNIIIINNERVPCEFHASVLTPEIDEKPMTRATAAADRIVKYKMLASDNTDTIVGEVKVNNPIYVDLLKGKTYKMVFFYSEQYSNVEDIAVITDANMFRYEENLKIDTSLTKTITLKRNIGQFVAKAGKMPKDATLDVTLASYSHINWFDNKLYSKTGEEFNSVDGVLATGDTLSLFGLPSMSPKSMRVNVAIVKNGHTIKSAEYLYELKANTIYTVTYNINNVDEDGSEFGDFTIEIDEEWSKPEDDNQQVGK